MRLSGTKTSSIHQYRGLGNQLWDLGGARPSLDLQFSSTKSLVDSVSGQQLVTFTRASSGTFVGSDGVLQTAANDVPRFDHNPTTGESLGLLVEEQRTNLLLRSEEFDNASWTVNAGAKTVTANTSVAPNGTQTADTVTADGTSAVHFIDQSVTVSAVPYTFSVYAKANTNNFIQFRTSTAIGNRHANFDVSTGATGTSTNITSSSIEAVGSGWYRCSVVFTPTAATGTIGILLVTSNSASSGQSNTLSTSVILWGAQLEAGAFPTSYIPTTGTTATRSADVASITGTNFSSWYRQDEGTVFAHWNAFGSNSFATVYCHSTGSGTSNLYELYRGSNDVTLVGRTRDAASSTDAINRTITSWVGTNKSAHAIAVNNAGLSVNGGSVGTLTSLALPAPTQLGIGADQVLTSTKFLNGHIRRLTYWPQRLSNTTLQTLTQ